MERTGNEPAIIVQPDPSSWMIESIETLGFDSNEIIEMDERMLHVDNLVLSTHRVHDVTGNYNPHLSEYEWLRNRAVGSLDEVDGPEKVYISRDDTDRRRAMNEGEIVSTLENRGFEKFELSTLHFREQVRALSSAKTIVSIHGSGLVNIVFTPDAEVVEILPDEHQKPSMYCLSRLLGFDYDYVVSKTVGTDVKKSDPWALRSGLLDVEVDVDELCDVINRSSDENEVDVSGDGEQSVS